MRSADVVLNVLISITAGSISVESSPESAAPHVFMELFIEVQLDVYPSGHNITVLVLVQLSQHRLHRRSCRKCVDTTTHSCVQTPERSCVAMLS